MKRKQHAGAGYLLLGGLLIAAALALAIWNLAGQNAAEKAAESALQSLTAAVAERREQTEQSDEQPLPLYEQQPDMTMPVVTLDGYDYIGYLSLPALELSLPVMSQWSYEQLKIAPCRYTGSVYSGDMVLAAHNYSSHFGRLSELSPGDEVVFTDADGHEFFYVVADVEILPPTAVEEMTAGEWPLTLFTCTYGGRTRLTIRCAAAEN